jgi:hypothetical protein
LILKEFDNGYTGEAVVVRVTNILMDYEFKGIANSHCIMSIMLIK